MIPDKIKEKIQKNAKEYLLEEDYPLFNKLFEECYILYEDMDTSVVLQPIHNLGMKFDIETGEFAGPEDWTYTKENGEKIIW